MRSRFFELVASLDHCPHMMKNIVTTLSSVMYNDHDKNVCIALRLLTDLHKQFRQLVVKEVHRTFESSCLKPHSNQIVVFIDYIQVTLEQFPLTLVCSMCDCAGWQLTSLDCCRFNPLGHMFRSPFPTVCSRLWTQQDSLHNIASIAVTRSSLHASSRCGRGKH